MNRGNGRMPGSVARTVGTIFLLLWLFVVFVSVFDGYLVLRYRQLIETTELNPVGRALLALNRGQIWYLLGAKFTGTVIAASVVLLLYDRRPRLGLATVAALAVLQLALLLYLLLG